MGRHLGQHFLTDRSILDRIVEAIDPHPDDVVIEIGPGKGALTARLAPRVGQVIAVEADPRLAEDCGWRIADFGLSESGPKVRIVQGDALRLDWAALAVQSAIRHPPSAIVFKVIGNIPYYITSLLIEKALAPPLPTVVVFLVQREFADRLAAAPGSKTYGALTVGVQSVASVERLFVVRAGAFQPPPKVDSAVVRLTPRDDPLVSGTEHPALRRFLAAVFSQRRKQLARSLRDVTGGSKSEVELLLTRLSIDRASRPEALTPGQLVSVFRGGESLSASGAKGKL